MMSVKLMIGRGGDGDKGSEWLVYVDSCSTGSVWLNDMHRPHLNFNSNFFIISIFIFIISIFTFIALIVCFIILIVCFIILIVCFIILIVCFIILIVCFIILIVCFIF